MMQLRLNADDATVTLIADDKELASRPFGREAGLLPEEIAVLLKESNYTLDDIEQVILIAEQGAFSDMRAVYVVAQMLASQKGIKILKRDSGGEEAPLALADLQEVPYSGDPSITT